MSLSRSTKFKGKNSPIRNIAVCILISIAVTLAVICIISAVFSLLECIAKNAVAPLSIAAAALGCFSGAYICSKSVREKGIIVGAIIGLFIFFIIFLVSCFDRKLEFGSAELLKLVIFVAAGCCGGYLGYNRRYCGKNRK